MKKLITMSLVVMATVVANAAASTWGISGAATASVKNGSAVWNTLAADGTAAAYLLLTESVADVKAALDGGTFTGADTVANRTTFTTRGRFSGVAIDLPTTSASYSMVLVYEDATTGNTWYQFSSATATASGSDDSSVPAVPAQFAATSFSSTGWTEVVPEPTSGLLLLLGVAGLALRRKQK